MKNTHRGVLLLVKFQAEACNFTKSNILPWVFFTFVKLYEWYQIAQNTTYTLCSIEISRLPYINSSLCLVSSRLDSPGTFSAAQFIDWLVYLHLGKIDVTVDVSIHRPTKLTHIRKSFERYLLPLELKTGKMWSKLGAFPMLDVVFFYLEVFEFKPFLPNAPFLYSLKTFLGV